MANKNNSNNMQTNNRLHNFDKPQFTCQAPRLRRQISTCYIPETKKGLGVFSVIRERTNPRRRPGEHLEYELHGIMSDKKYITSVRINQSTPLLYNIVYSRMHYTNNEFPNMLIQDDKVILKCNSGKLSDETYSLKSYVYDYIVNYK